MRQLSLVSSARCSSTTHVELSCLQVLGISLVNPHIANMESVEMWPSHCGVEQVAHPDGLNLKLQWQGRNETQWCKAVSGFNIAMM